MAEVVALQPTLSDSTFKTRPNFKAYIQVDTNAGLDSVEQNEHQRLGRQRKFPSIHGRKDAPSFNEPFSAQPFRKYNDEGDHRALAPNRFGDTVIDPVCGFISPAGDITHLTGVTKLKNFVHVSDTPQDHNPYLRDSRRLAGSAPSELRRESTNSPSQPSYWNGRKTLDISTRAKLGGGTSTRDPLAAQKESLLKGVVYERPNTVSQDVRDKLALQYMYKSSTQRQYEDVPWDTMLPPKLWAPPTTLEPRADQVDQRYKLKRYATDASEYQLVGGSWDTFQTRNGYFKKQPWIDFTSPCARRQQIPLYGGSIGAANLDEIDNQMKPFVPYTVMRTEIPQEASTSNRPYIPGYTGSTLYSRQGGAALHIPPGTMPPESSMTSVYQHKMANIPHDHKRDSHMSKMVTLVPPHNPFNKQDRMPQPLKV